LTESKILCYFEVLFFYDENGFIVILKKLRMDTYMNPKMRKIIHIINKISEMKDRRIG